MARPVAENKAEQDEVRAIYIWMAEVFRNEREDKRLDRDPLKQTALAIRLGLDQSCLSRWLTGKTVTLQKPGAWEELLKTLSDARQYLPKAGWIEEPYLYYSGDGYVRQLDFKRESTWQRVSSRKLEVLCDHWCRRCHGLTPRAGMFCMHCGAVVSLKGLDDDMSHFLLDGDSWEIDINDYTREPVGRRHRKRKAHERQLHGR